MKSVKKSDSVRLGFVVKLGIWNNFQASGPQAGKETFLGYISPPQSPNVQNFPFHILLINTNSHWFPFVTLWEDPENRILLGLVANNGSVLLINSSIEQ